MTKRQPLDQPLFLGIEGGGTRTVCLLADAQNTLITRLETGPANLKLLNDAQLLCRLRALAPHFPMPASICIGLAGLRDTQDAARVLNAANRIWPKVPCCACSDLETALSAAEPAPTASVHAQVLLLSGTGSCCFGRGPNGRTARVGGWGHLLGDKGSAYEMGLRALKAVVFYYDRDGVWPALGETVLRFLQLNAPDDLVTWAQGAEKKAIAALAMEVFEAWAHRDTIALDIVEAAADSLAKDAVACAKRLVSERIHVQFILAGSVLLKQPRFAKRVTELLGQRWKKACVTPLRKEGAWGAIRLAQVRLGKAFTSLNEPRKVHAHGAASDSQGLWGRSTVQSGLLESQAAVLPIPEATAPSPTERRNPKSLHLDTMPLTAAVRLMLNEEGKVAPILLQHERDIARAVQLIVSAFRRGGRLFYVGAGTSGRLGTLDASECPPTFRVPPDQVQGIMAGGQQALWQSFEGAEDDAQAGAAAIQFRGVNRQDIVIGIAASGRTPFVWGALHEAKRRQAKTVLVCFNPHWTISRRHSPDLVIAADLGPEVLTGSTRLKAGTATKLLLNAFTTLAMVRLGKVVSNLMVDLNPSNQKLRQRAVRIVRELTKVDEASAFAALQKSGWVIEKALRQLRPTKTG